MAEFTGSPSICATSFACIENTTGGDLLSFTGCCIQFTIHATQPSIHSMNHVLRSMNPVLRIFFTVIQICEVRHGALSPSLLYAQNFYCDTHPLWEAGELGSTCSHPSVLPFLFRHFDMHVTVHSHLKAMSSRREEKPSRTKTLSNYKVQDLHWKSRNVTAAFTNASPSGLQADGTL